MPWWTYLILGALSVTVYDLSKHFLKRYMKKGFFLSLICFVLTVAICTAVFATIVNIFPELKNN